MKIRSILIAGVAALSLSAPLAIATNASAAAVNINIGAVSNAQTVMDETNQAAIAIAAADGNVDNNSAVTADALDSVNLNSDKFDTNQDAWGLNGQLVLASNNQVLEEETNQLAGSAALADGNVTGYSKVAATASNLANTNIVTVTTTQK